MMTCRWCRAEQPTLPVYAGGVEFGLPPRGWCVVAREGRRIAYCSVECREAGEAFVGDAA